MSRPTTISDDQILGAARAVFLERGAAATTAEVARRAGIAEGSIFKRYKTKSDLFKAAMHLDLEGEPEWFRTLRSWKELKDPRELLHVAGLQMIEFFRRLLPVQIMRWSTGSQFGLPEELRGPDSPPLRALKLLGAFFERQMKEGRMRRHDPEIVARIFLGSIQSFVFFEILMRLQDQMPMPVETYLRGVIQLIWTGSAPLETDAKKREPSKRKKER
jgi:AcrR family transcriptional regulator